MTYIPGVVNRVSTVNSSTTLLSGSATFTGTSEDATNYSTITINIYSDVASANSGIKIEFSTDSSTWRFITTDTYQATFKYSQNFPVRAKYYRIVYTNGSSAQGSFTLQTILTVGMNTALIPTNSPSYDAFGRQRTAQPYTILDITQLANNAASGSSREGLLIDLATTGAGSTTYNSTESSVTLSVTGNGDSVTRQSHRYFVYQPGKSFLVVMTGILNNGSNASTVTSRIGYFDDDNGFFFQYSGGTLSIVQRSQSLGTTTTVAQSDWNVDPLDGSGTSGITLDISKGLIFFFNLQWLGAGEVWCGVMIDKIYITAHVFRHANLIDKPYITSPNLPTRFQISSTSGAGSLKAICTTVESEGGYQPVGKQFTFGNGITTITTSGTTETGLFVIALSDSYRTANIVPSGIEVLATTADNCLWRLRYYKNAAASNPLGAVVMAAVNSDSSAVAAVGPGTLTTTGSIVINQGYFSTQVRTSVVSDILNGNTQLIIRGGIDNAAASKDYLVLTVTSLASGATVAGSITWAEL